MNLPWFGPKLIGWGIGPRSWEGWVVLGVAIAALLLVGRLPGVSGARAIIARLAILLVLGGVVWLTYGDAGPAAGVSNMPPVALSRAEIQ